MESIFVEILLCSKCCYRWITEATVVAQYIEELLIKLTCHPFNA